MLSIKEMITHLKSQDDMEIGDEDANTRGRHYTEEEEWSITRYITLNKCLDNVRGQ
jgi:hypothetical protein